MSPTVEAEDGGTEMFGTLVSDMQTGVTVTGKKKITGTLKYLTEGALPEYWGAGNFLALKFTNNDESVTSIKVGLRPSESGMDPVELDEDMNGAFQINDKDNQKLIVISESADYTKTDVYDLSGLTLEGEE